MIGAVFTPPPSLVRKIGMQVQGEIGMLVQKKMECKFGENRNASSGGIGMLVQKNWNASSGENIGMLVQKNWNASSGENIGC